jgi:HK97 family phage portal protein
LKLLKIFNQRQKYNDKQPLVRRPLSFSAGTVISPDTSMEISAYFRAVTYLSSQIAKLPLFIKTTNNRKEFNKIFDLINRRPNPEMSAFQFKQWLIQQAMHYGNAYVEIERQINGEPLWLWPIMDEDVVPYRTTTDRELVYGIYPSNSPEFYIRKEDVFHLPSLFTKDGIVGQGIVSYAWETLGIAKGADKFANSLFANAGIPSGVLQAPQRLSDEAYSRIRSSWKEQMGGRKTGSTAILEEGMTYQSITMSPDVLQFLESRKFSVSEIARFTGISPSKLYDIEAQKYGNAEEDGLAFANDTLSVWAANIEAQVNAKLLVGRYERFMSEFDLYQAFKADMKTRSSYFKDRMQTASITPNEIRQMEGDEPYDGGDRYFIASNNFSPMDRMDELLDSQIDKGESNDNNAAANPAPPPADTNIENETNRLFAEYLKSKIDKNGKP